MLVAEDSPSDMSVYRDLVTRAKGGDAMVDYRQMRFLCLRLSACRVRSSPDELGKLNSLTDPNASIAYAETLLDQGFVNTEVHATQAAMFQKLGDFSRSVRSFQVIAGLLGSILRGRDGKSPESAYEVVVDREIYMVLAARRLPPGYGPGLVAVEPSTIGTRKYTRYALKDPRSGDTVSVYFDVTAFEEKSVGAVPPVRR